MPNTKRTSAHYQREYRRRLREQGLVKKEVWILPENAKRLAAYEKELRRHNGESTQHGEKRMPNVELWNTQSLYTALGESELVSSGAAHLEMLEGADPSILVTMQEYGELPLFMTVVGEQILVEATLWPVSAVKDRAGFNETVLRTHKLFPLSTISLDTLGGEGDFYQMFGALSAGSILESVVFEIEVLADNVIKATEAYSQFVDDAA